MNINWCCPYCETEYDLTELINFDSMDECCQYYYRENRPYLW